MWGVAWAASSQINAKKNAQSPFLFYGAHKTQQANLQKKTEHTTEHTMQVDIMCTHDTHTYALLGHPTMHPLYHKGIPPHYELSIIHPLYQKGSPG